MKEIDPYQYYSKHFNQSLTEVDENFVRKIVPYLSNSKDNQNEQILWMGQPSKWIVLRKIDLQIIPLCLIILWFSYGDYSTGRMTIDLSSYSILVYLLLFYLYIGRFIHDIIRRHRIKYAVTDHQVFIQSGIFKSQLKVFQIKEWDLLLQERRNGKGTIQIQKKNEYYPTGFAKFLLTIFMPKGFRAFSTMAGYSSIPQIESIENARDIYEMMVNPLLKIQREADK